jgi:Uri superfamily endonuclease
MDKVLPATSGTYILLLYLPRKTVITVGRLGWLAFKRGWYTYVGTAFGPGGLAARLSRHLKQKKKCHWHIDYLRVEAVPKQIWYCNAAKSMEHIWAAAISKTGGVPVAGFGSSDCRCPSHLFFFSRRPDYILSELRINRQVIKMKM